MDFPDTLKYTDDHEWLRIEDNNIAYIGITYFAQSELGEIVYVEVETVGETLEKGEEFGIVEAVKTTSDLYMPVSGEILEFNPLLNESDQPELINNDPYGEGWIVKIKLSNPDELDSLLTAKGYKASISQ